jgi:hypothetical protein
MCVFASAQDALAASDVLKKTIFPDQWVDLDQAAKWILQSNPTLVFLGEDHTNLHLADGALALLTSLHQIRPVKCLFVELPSDLQNDVDASVAQLDPIKLYKAMNIIMKPAYLGALARMGYDTDRLAISSRNIDAIIEKVDYPEMNRISLSDDLLFFVRANGIHMLAYNVDSKSKEFMDGTYYIFMDELAKPSSDRDILSLQAVYARSQIMEKNILEKAKSHECTNAVVIVGQQHLMNQEFIKSQWGQMIPFTSMQTSLEKEGYSSAVVIAHSSRGAMPSTKFVLNVETAGEFERCVGSLLTP